ncbi:MAG: gamma-glutamyltransferase, partial [Myxococcota bacterium]
IAQGFTSRSGSTSHISVVDQWGNAAALTGSNGEGSGIVPQGTGMMLNNMLGEEDLSPNGFHQWQPNTRVSSMMAPTLVLDAKQRWRIVTGSGGSNRIRSAILQVLTNLIDFHMTVDQAVNGPRLHWEPDGLHLEPGFDSAAYRLDRFAPVVEWSSQNMFFGGVHTIIRRSDGVCLAAGDHRRSGTVATT